MADVMLTPALLLLLPAPANDAWVERLDFPNLVQADLNLAVRDEDLGLRGFDLGFPDDPRDFACAVLVVCALPDCRVVYQDVEWAVRAA